MKENKMLPSTLHKLAEKIEEKIDESVKKGELLVESKPHTKAKISNFKYEEGITGYHISYEDIVSEEWNLEEKRNLVES